MLTSSRCHKALLLRPKTVRFSGSTAGPARPGIAHKRLFCRKISRPPSAAAGRFEAGRPLYTGKQVPGVHCRPVGVTSVDKIDCAGRVWASICDTHDTGHAGRRPGQRLYSSSVYRVGLVCNGRETGWLVQERLQNACPVGRWTWTKSIDLSRRSYAIASRQTPRWSRGCGLPHTHTHTQSPPPPPPLSTGRMNAPIHGGDWRNIARTVTSSGALGSCGQLAANARPVAHSDGRRELWWVSTSSAWIARCWRKRVAGGRQQIRRQVCDSTIASAGRDNFTVGKLVRRRVDLLPNACLSERRSSYKLCRFSPA